MKVIFMMELDGEIDGGNWYPVIDDGMHTFVPHRSKDGSVAWRRMESIRKAE